MGVCEKLKGADDDDDGDELLLSRGRDGGCGDGAARGWGPRGMGRTSDDGGSRRGQTRRGERQTVDGAGVEDRDRHFRRRFLADTDDARAHHPKRMRIHRRPRDGDGVARARDCPRTPRTQDRTGGDDVDDHAHVGRCRRLLRYLADVARTHLDDVHSRADGCGGPAPRSPLPEVRRHHPGIPSVLFGSGQLTETADGFVRAPADDLRASVTSSHRPAHSAADLSPTAMAKQENANGSTIVQAVACLASASGPEPVC